MTKRERLEKKLFEDTGKLEESIDHVFEMAEDMCGSWHPDEMDLGREWVRAVRAELRRAMKESR